MNKKISNFIKKKNKTKLVTLTAYSKNIASVLDNYCDLILVGDSLGSVLYNYKSTREVTLNTMIEHSKSVRMGSIFFKSIEINFPFLAVFSAYCDQLPGAAPISITFSPPLNILYFSSISINL